MTDQDQGQLNRRDFLRGGSAATLMMMMGGIPLQGAESASGETHYKGETPPLNVGVIGCGTWGREILKTLSGIKFGPVVAVCDTYPAYLRRGGRLAPEAKKYADYRKLLEDDKVQGVIVATPTHQHKQVVLDALKAGKHVYCEAPLASTVDDAREIAEAAKNALEVNFQAGLQNRADKQIVNLEQFIRSGTLGKTLKCRAQYHQKTSWRRTSPNPEREKEINWRLRRSESLGLVGELGIHQVDVSNWYMRKLPKAIHGYGSLLQWQDGRDVPDNVVAVLEYPDGTFLVYESTIANSYNAIKQIFFGSNCAILMRDRRAWMFKEADAPLLGWEVYAKRDTFYTETGVVLGAGSTKQAEREKVGASAGVIDPTSALQYSLQNFLINSYNHGAAVADFKQMFEGADRDALADYLKDLAKNRLPAAGYREGYQATVSVIKANEAVLGNKRIDLDETLFRI